MPARSRHRRLPAPAAHTTAVVTGASSGIGAAIAAELAARGHPLLLTARSREGLEAVAARLPVRVTTIAADLATDGGRADVVAAIEAADPPVGILVNNAGAGRYGPLADHSAADVEAAVAVNVLAPTVLARSVLGVAGAGVRFLVVSSTALGSTDPELGVYLAGKAFAESLAGALRREVHGRGGVVTVVRPAWTRTRFHERSGEDVSGVPVGVWLEPAEVAGAAVAGLEEGRDVVEVRSPDPRPVVRRLAGHAYHAARRSIGR